MLNTKINKQGLINKVIIPLIVLVIVSVVYFEEDIFHSKRNAFESTLSEYYIIQTDKKDFKELDLKTNEDEVIAIRSSLPMSVPSGYVSTSTSCTFSLYNIKKESEFVFNQRIIANNHDLIIYNNNLYVNKTTQEKVSKNQFINYMNRCIEDENSSLIKKEQLKNTWKKD